MRARACGETFAGSRSARDTVIGATPATRATSTRRTAPAAPRRSGGLAIDFSLTGLRTARKMQWLRNHNDDPDDRATKTIGGSDDPTRPTPLPRPGRRTFARDRRTAASVR